MPDDNQIIIKFGRSVNEDDLTGLLASEDVIEALIIPSHVHINFDIVPFHILDQTYQVIEEVGEDVTED